MSDPSEQVGAHGDEDLVLGDYDEAIGIGERFNVGVNAGASQIKWEQGLRSSFGDTRVSVTLHFFAGPRARRTILHASIDLNGDARLKARQHSPHAIRASWTAHPEGTRQNAVSLRVGA